MEFLGVHRSAREVSPFVNLEYLLQQQTFLTIKEQLTISLSLTIFELRGILQVSCVPWISWMNNFFLYNYSNV